MYGKRGNRIEDLKRRFFSNANIVTKIITINVLVFFFTWFYTTAIALSGNYEVVSFTDKWFAIPSTISKLIFKPWTFFTYMFLHAGLFHIFWNMYVLYWFGNIFGQMLGFKKILPLYILGGLAGAFLYVFAYNVFPYFEGVEGSMVGASAGVMAVVIATSVMFPNYRVNLLLFGSVKLLYIGLAIFILTSFDLTGNNAGGSFAHIGGAVLGWITMIELKKGKDWLKVSEDVWKSLFFWFYAKRKSKVKVYHRSKNPKKEKNKINASRQEKLDAILDKISTSGYDSLSANEKEFLFNISKKDEDQN